MLIRVIVVIILQFIQISNHYIVHSNTVLYLNDISVKLRKKLLNNIPE